MKKANDSVTISFMNEPIPTLSWTNMENWANPLPGHPIRIRGFIYEVNGKKILASSPDLKSCCLGRPEKVAEQIVILGDIHSISAHKTVLLEGTLSQHHENGKSVWELENTHLIQEENHSWILAALFIAAIFIWLTGKLRKLFNKRNRAT